MSKVLDKLVKYMVKYSRDGVFYGSPRKRMEKISVSSGPLYQALKELGIVQYGKGKDARWVLPQSVIDRYSKKGTS